MNRITGSVLVALCFLGLTNCTSGNGRGILPGIFPVQSIAATSGTPQSHAVNGTFGSALVATVTTDGTPTSGITVTFTAPATGPSATFSNTTSLSANAVSDANGLATSPALTANGVSGSYTVTATIAGVPTPASFSLTNTTGSPAAILATSGTPQSAPVNAAFALPLVATVVDSGQNPVSGAVVTFTAPATGATGTFVNTTATETDITNANGVATSTTFTANGTSGGYVVTASVAGVSAPANFNLANSGGTPVSVVATSGTPQVATINTAFAAPLVATVFDASSNPVGGVAVTFTAPTSGATGTFANASATETDITDASGMATSTTFTANGNVGGPYTVTATIAGVSTAANFSLSNRAVTTGTTTFVFSLSGQEATGPDFYALAGSVQIDANGNVLAGVQDYNDANFGHSSPEPGGDAITAGALSVDATTGLGTLTLTTNNSSLGVGGVETLGVQFVNTNHALIMQFDGTATSSGSLDLQTLPSSLSGAFAFTLAGVENSLGAVSAVAFGGVFSIASGTLQNGSADTNENGAVTIGSTLTGTVSSADSFGRGTITNSLSIGGTPIALHYYVVGPEAIRIIDIDLSDSAIGSAYGQGANPFSNASIGNSVLAIAGSPYPTNYAVAGMFSSSNTSSSPADFSGVADVNEPSSSFQFSASAISGTYSVLSNGYGNLTISSASLGDVSLLGIYMTDPHLNLSDPNNTTTGLGGALIADLDSALAGGTGILVPQIDTSSSSFTGNYAVAAQGFNDLCCEFDFVAPATMSGNILSGTKALVGDPFLTLSGTTATNTAATFSGSPKPDSGNVGRYTMFSTNSPANPLALTVNAQTTSFDVAIYQASGGQLFWIDEGATSVFLGSLLQQGSLSGLLGTGRGSAASIAATSGTPQSATIGTDFASPLVATVTTGGSPTSGVVVTFTAPSSGPSGVFADTGINITTVTTNSSGVATAPAFTANTSTGAYTVTATAAGVSTPANFSLTNTAGATEIIVASGGTPQSTVISTTFAAPLAATVTTGGVPTSGVVVTFTAPSSGPSGVFADTGINITTVTTNSNGVAAAPALTANTITGAYTVTATAAGVSTPADFSLTNTAAVTEIIVASGGTPQSTVINTTFAAPLAATVTTGGVPTSGVVVTFTAPTSGASGAFAGTNSNTATATTNASGVATSPAFTANGTTGSYTVTATAAGVSAGANFSLTNTPSTPATITATSGTPQTATVGSAFAAPLVATVLDSGSHPVSGVLVTFTAPSSGASATFAGATNIATATTNASGMATSPILTANATTGAYTVTASVAGVSTPANFSLTNAAAVPATITATSGTPQSAPIHTAFAAPLVATVLDSASHPVSGAVVTFTAPVSGASGTFAGTNTNTATATTNASGAATSPVFTANGTAGSYTVTASVPGVSTPANFSLTNAAATPASITATSGTPQTATIDTTFAAPFGATVLDSGSHPVSGVVVTFTAPSSGASGTFADTHTVTTTATTNTSGVATSPAFTANGTAGSYTVSASVAGVATAADFSLTNAARVPATITATSGTPQSTAINTAFASPLGATVLDGSSNPVSGVVVTFTAPTSGASGTFADTHGNTTTATTNASGVATSTVFTANGTAGAYSVSATVSGVATPANFSLTNTPPAATKFVFSLSGQEANGPDFYALAGAVQIDSSGNVLAGVQDYNDAGNGHSSPEPEGDTILGGTLSVNSSTGQGTLTLTTNNSTLGVNGVETLGVQFVNSNHALIMQFDGTATSSGSLDLQTLPTTLSGGYAFTLAGLDSTPGAVAFGGIFSITGTSLHDGLFDTNDNGAVTTGASLSGTISAADSFGRGTVTSSLNFAGTPIALNYYVVGPEAVRIIDVDPSDAAIGSAFGQGSGSFSNASIGSSVLAIAGSPYPTNYAVAGMFSTSNTSSSVADFSGVADDNEVSYGFQVAASSFSGTYSVDSNGYGNYTISSASLGDVTTLGVYVTDPHLNLSDPNNTTSGLGGALVADLDSALAGGTGILVPQTDTSSSSFTGTYAVSAQGFNDMCCEFDLVGLGKMNSGVLTGTALLGDPFLTLSGTTGTNTGVAFSGTPKVDTSHAGRYTLFTTNSPPNPLNIKIKTAVTSFDVAIYQASGGQLFWLNEDGNSVFLGSLNKQGSLTGIPKITNVTPQP